MLFQSIHILFFENIRVSGTKNPQLSLGVFNIFYYFPINSLTFAFYHLSGSGFTGNTDQVSASPG